jgi:hypothetical protein
MSPPRLAIADAARALVDESEFTASVFRKDQSKTVYRFRRSERGRVMYHRVGSRTWHDTDAWVPGSKRARAATSPERQSSRGPTFRRAATFTEGQSPWVPPIRRAATFAGDPQSSWGPTFGRAATPPPPSSAASPPSYDFGNLSNAFEYLNVSSSSTPRAPDEPAAPRRREPSPRRTTGPDRASRPAAPPTEAERQAAGIPPGYSAIHWRPGQLAFVLLGSAFAPDALGRWIHNWAVRCGDPRRAYTAELAPLLADVAAGLKDAEALLPRLSDPDTREMLQDFISSARKRVLGVDRPPTADGTDLRSILETCSEAMGRVMKEKPRAHTEAGRAFTETLLGENACLARVEALLRKLKTWRLRFDANITPLLPPSS